MPSYILTSMNSHIIIVPHSLSESDDPKAQCILDEDQSGLTWDAICFVFLLMQLRIYKSHYFRHVVNELAIQAKLASRLVNVLVNSQSASCNN